MDFAALCHFGTSPFALGNASVDAEEEEFFDFDLEEDLERELDDLLSFLKTEGIASSSKVGRALDRPWMGNEYVKL